MKDKPKKEQSDKKPQQTWPRKFVVTLVFILAAFVGSDLYFNEWRTIKRIEHWNKLELKNQNNLPWQLKAKKDFQLIGIRDVRTITKPESLLVFDQPFRDSGYYRLYFRLSDTSSAQLQKMSQLLSSLDSSGALNKSIEDSKRVYQNIQVLLGITAAPIRDTSIVQTVQKPAPSRETLAVRTKDATQKFSQGDLTMGTDDEAAAAVKKIFGSPQVILGVGIGIAVSTGLDLLKGKAYCAISKNDVFHIDSLKLGAQAGLYEGCPIDILWALQKKDAQQTQRDSTHH